MAAYGLLKGLGGAASNIAEDIGQRLKEERLAEQGKAIRQEGYDQAELVYGRKRTDQLADREVANKRDDTIRAEDFAQQEKMTNVRHGGTKGVISQWHKVLGEDGKNYRVGTDNLGNEVKRLSAGSSTSGKKLDPRVEKLVDVRMGQLKAMEELGLHHDDENAMSQHKKLTKEINSLLNYEADTFSADKLIIDSILQANPGKDREWAIEYGKYLGELAEDFSE